MDNDTYDDFQVYLLGLEGKFIDGQVFQNKLEESYYPMNNIIPGLSGILLNIHLDETVEAIIPASLGYGYRDDRGIPGGSTLIFTFTLIRSNEYYQTKGTFGLI